MKAKPNLTSTQHFKPQFYKHVGLVNKIVSASRNNDPANIKWKCLRMKKLARGMFTVSIKSPSCP
jgi:hypothetical protein